MKDSEVELKVAFGRTECYFKKNNAGVACQIYSYFAIKLHSVEGLFRHDCLRRRIRTL
jgi:hypothetical protein